MEKINKDEYGRLTETITMTFLGMNRINNIDKWYLYFIDEDDIPYVLLLMTKDKTNTLHHKQGFATFQQIDALPDTYMYLLKDNISPKITFPPLSLEYNMFSMVDINNHHKTYDINNDVVEDSTIPSVIISSIFTYKYLSINTDGIICDGYAYPIMSNFISLI